jgi:hypothetical protein
MKTAEFSLWKKLTVVTTSNFAEAMHLGTGPDSGDWLELDYPRRKLKLLNFHHSG